MEKERTLRDSVLVRWSALGIVAFTMMAGIFCKRHYGSAENYVRS